MIDSLRWIKRKVPSKLWRTVMDKAGGPAFPSKIPACTVDGKVTSWHEVQGMTLRDYMAGQALVGMNSNPELMESMTKTSIEVGSHFEALAKNAYKQADAMIKARGETDVYDEIARKKAAALDQLLADIKAGLVRIVPVDPNAEMVSGGVPEYSQYGANYAEATFRAMVDRAPAYEPLKYWPQE